MAWEILGTYYGSCSCKVGCPCALGELEADQGWCSGFLAFDIRSGSVDGVDVGGTRSAFIGDWPSGFLSGNGTARLYFDPAVSQEQRSQLEGVFTGKKGGDLEVMAALVSSVLSPVEASIEVSKDGDVTNIRVGDVGTGVITALKDQHGGYTRLLHGAATFREDINLAKGLGSSWQDPDTRKWESAGHAEFAEFDWKG
jgi:hypothetical protein